MESLFNPKVMSATVRQLLAERESSLTRYLQATEEANFELKKVKNLSHRIEKELMMEQGRSAYPNQMYDHNKRQRLETTCNPTYDAANYQPPAPPTVAPHAPFVSDHGAVTAALGQPDLGMASTNTVHQFPSYCNASFNREGQAFAHPIAHGHVDVSHNQIPSHGNSMTDGNTNYQAPGRDNNNCSNFRK